MHHNNRRPWKTFHHYGVRISTPYLFHKIRVAMSLLPWLSARAQAKTTISLAIYIVTYRVQYSVIYPNRVGWAIMCVPASSTINQGRIMILTAYSCLSALYSAHCIPDNTALWLRFSICFGFSSPNCSTTDRQKYTVVQPRTPQDYPLVTIIKTIIKYENRDRFLIMSRASVRRQVSDSGMCTS